MPEARTKIEFTEATHDAFAAFSDEVETHLPGTHLTFVDNPIFGDPYIIIKINRGDPWSEFTLIVDSGEKLCVGDNLFWIERP